MIYIINITTVLAFLVALLALGFLRLTRQFVQIDRIFARVLLAIRCNPVVNIVERAALGLLHRLDPETAHGLSLTALKLRLRSGGRRSNDRIDLP